MDWTGLNIVLASTSPRRRELLAAAGVPFRIVSPELDDADLHMGPVPLRQWVTSLAYLKARAGTEAYRRANPVHTPTIVIGADTLVDFEGQVLSKPLDVHDAERMMRLIQGQSHEVLTGVAILDASSPTSTRRQVFYDRAIVKFGWLGNDRIRDYLASGLWKGKAGGYNLEDQLRANWPISTSGDPGTVMGLPMLKLLPRLHRFAQSLQKEHA